MLSWITEKRRWVWLLAIALAVLAGIYYSHALMRWLAYDDEGGYLYAAWRISLGEAPYRDFLTPQLPVFLYPGAVVLALSGYSVQAARISMIVYILLSGLLAFGVTRRLWGDLAGLLALGMFFVHEEIYWAARYFRPEAPMLFWGLVGLCILAASYERRRKVGLALAGAALALATMSKLFGALMMAGVGLFVLAEGVRTRDWRDFWRTGLWLAGSYFLVLGLFWGAFSVVSGDFTAAVLGHHLRQGRGTPLIEVVTKGLSLYWSYVRSQPVLWALTALGVVAAWKARPERRIFVWQIPSILAFLAMSRDLQARHFTYVVPSLAICAAAGLTWLLAQGRRLWPWPRAQWLLALPVAALLLGMAWPEIEQNALVVQWGDTTTPEWTAYVQDLTEPDEYVISDYPGINFYARRPTTRLAAGISRGAAQSGQITGAALIQEIEQSQARLVLINVAQGAHQFASLRDYDVFKRYVQEHFYLIERKQYDYRLLEVYYRDDTWAGERRDVVLGDQLALTGVLWEEQTVPSGGQARAILRWQSLADMAVDYDVTLRLLDDDGNEWGLGSKSLTDVDRDTYWDERGLERAVRIPTSEWPLSEQSLDNYELPIDAGTPPGTYRVVMRVHPQDSWSALVAQDAQTGETGLLDVLIGTVTVTAPEADAAVPDVGYAIGAQLSDGLVLLGGASAGHTARPGDTLTLPLVWQTDAQTAAQDVAVTLMAEEPYELYRGPLLGPNAQPDQLDSVVQLQSQYALKLPAAVEAGTYALQVTVGDASPIPVAELTITGQPRVFTAPAMQHSNGALAAGVARLLGNDLDVQQAQPGQQIVVILYWQAEQTVDVAYTVFVHLLDSAQLVVAQHDAMPANGESPTTSWIEGQVITDEHVLQVPDDAAAGDYTIEIGLYDATTGARVPLYAADGQRLADDRLLIDTVEIAVPAGS